MSIQTILKKLKDANMLADSEESLSLFSDCLNKFGISLLLLNDETKFDRILNILNENGIPLQKANGIYALRIFAVDVLEIENIISQFDSIGELDFLRIYPEKIAEAGHIRQILDQIQKCQKEGIPYKNESNYDLDLLLFSNQSSENTSVNECIKKYLSDPSLLERLIRLDGNSEEDVNVALELQKAENLICEEYLLPVDDGWKIVINNKEVNSFQDVKDTINTIINLNLPVTFHDALFIVLFYKTKLSAEEIEEIINRDLSKEVK